MLLTKKFENIKGMKQMAGGNFSTVGAFVVLFVYGVLLLMIGFTNAGIANSLNYEGSPLQSLTGPTSVWLVMPQAGGLLLATLMMKFFLKRFNVRTILGFGFAATIILLVLISQFDRMAGGLSDRLSTGSVANGTAKYVQNAADKPVGALIAFLILTFCLGFSIGFSSPLVSTFLGSNYEGKKRSTILSLANGAYGVGAGFLPLVLASTFYSINNSGNFTGGATFNTERYFYYVAIGLAVVALCGALLMNYRHSEQKLSAKVLDETSKKEASGKETKKAGTKGNFSIFIPVVLVVTVMFFYMVSETFANYGFTSLASAGETNRNHTVDAAQAFGLFFVLQGIVRCVSGLTITKWVHNKTFIIGSVFFLIIAFIMFSAGAVSSTVGLSFLVAVFLAVGLGNVWPMIFSYAVGIDSRRSSFIGTQMNIISNITIPIAVAIFAAIGYELPAISQTLVHYSPRNGAYLARCLIPLVFGLGIIGFTLLTSSYLKKAKIQHEDEIEPSLASQYLRKSIAR